MSDRLVGHKEKSYWRLTVLVVYGLVSFGIYCLLLDISDRFQYDVAATERPILIVLFLFAALFALYLLSIQSVRSLPQTGSLIGIVLGFAVLFRGVLLFSTPIQEVDIYRYLWDGAVSTAGVSPFRFSPDQIRYATVDPVGKESLRTLVQICQRDQTLGQILERVHFGELPTIYPPVSQAVFALASWSMPSNGSINARLIVMKAWLIGFDLLTLLMVVLLLRRLRMSIGLSLIYGWCPLVLKEISNSGHLDSIAVFLTSLFFYILVCFVVSGRQQKTASRIDFSLSFFAAIVLALSVGAKLYPIVLTPILFAAFGLRLGWYRLVFPAAVFIGLVGLLLAPMSPRPSLNDQAIPPVAESEGPPLPILVTDKSPTLARDPSLGIRTFLKQWEINDFLFLILIENVRPSLDLPPSRQAWFVVVPESVRSYVVQTVSKTFKVPTAQVPFLVARAITSGIFALLMIWFAWLAMRSCKPQCWLEYGFLTLAWFWLLSPTQNPWYWVWVMPLLPFVRNPTWYVISGLALVYYLRFWFDYHWPHTSVWETRYPGISFFDFLVVWIEFGPWLFVLTWTGYLARSKRLRSRGFRNVTQLPNPS